VPHAVFQKEKFMIRKYLLLLAVSACTWNGFAQKSYNEQVQEYIARFKELAIQEQQRTGIPASITLAQGIFETGAGSSELCVNASNHFGIKCKNTWNGETYTYTDDAKDECFRKYNSAKHSYIDHSDFLKGNKRYSSLFALSPTDYAAWAYGLKRCGYATNPQYARKLIKTIEDFKLQEFTYAALGNNPEEEVLLASAADVPLPRTKVATAGEHIPDNDGYAARQTPARKHAAAEESADELYVEKASAQEAAKANSNVTEYYQPTTRNNLKGFYAKKGDMLLEYAIRNKIRYAKLLELNDLPDAPLEADMFIYLERKARTGQSATHTVENGESLIQISQHEGIQLQQLRLLNHLGKGEEPVAGTVLQLQTPADTKPELYAANTGRQSSNWEQPRRTANDEGFVPAGKKDAEPVATAQQDEEAEDAPAAANNQRVNIADEKPVEEEIAEERKKTVPAKDESKMTPLEKLKAHMDKTVYAERSYEPKKSGHYDETENDDTEAIATTPARRNTATAARYNPPAEERKAADKKKKDTLKPKAKAKVKSHTVRKGETLFEIAQKYDLTVSQLQKLNKLSGSKKIQPGMKLKVAK
jgi:LysM repeat protein